MLNETMTHNDFNTCKDIIAPMRKFFADMDIDISLQSSNKAKVIKSQIKIPPSYLIDGLSQAEKTTYERLVKNLLA